jgi:hypothetical protein
MGRSNLNISYSRYSALLNNMEKFRLLYMLGLTPEGDDTPTMWNIGRRRGRCFHSTYEGTPRPELVAEYGADLVKRVEAMVEVVPALGELDWVERSFSIPIGDGKHTIIGRIDHRFLNRDGNRQLGDFKTTKGTRTKAQLTDYFHDLENSTQHHFYLRAEREFSTEPTGLFTYHVILDRKDKDKVPTYIPLEVPYIGPAEVDRTMSAVYAACNVLEGLIAYGIEKPWPDSRKWYPWDSAYQGLAGRTIPKGCVPPGFTSKYKEQITEEA